MNTYENDSLDETTTRLFRVANIVGDTYKRNIENDTYISTIVRNYGNQSDARILIIDDNRQVLFDSFNSLVGNSLNNEEVRQGLRGNSYSDVYPLNDSRVLQLSVPINYSDSDGSATIGGVVISSSLRNLDESIGDLRSTIIRISFISIIVAFILIAISTSTITKSLRRLTIGVEKIFSGHLGYKVEIQDKGEIGKLGNTFNHMSERLNSIESNRKSYINSISHELRTPITSINALIDSLLLGDNTKETYDEYLRDIQIESLRMKELVDYLMGSIKLEDITLDLNEEKLSTIVKESISIISPYAHKHNVKIKMNLDDDIIVSCDKNRTKEVMLNLLENGIKYRDGSKSNSYILVTLKKEGKYFNLNVEDNGIGIDKKESERIFERGFRVLSQDSLTQQKIEGYGIGLALVKNIVEKHNWKIGFNSEPVLGTIFHIKGNIH